MNLSSQQEQARAQYIPDFARENVTKGHLLCARTLEIRTEQQYPYPSDSVSAAAKKIREHIRWWEVQSVRYSLVEFICQVGIAIGISAAAIISSFIKSSLFLGLFAATGSLLYISSGWLLQRFWLNGGKSIPILFILRSRRYEGTFRDQLARTLPALGPAAGVLLPADCVRVLTQLLDWRHVTSSSVILETLVFAGNRDTERAIQTFIRHCPPGLQGAAGGGQAVECLERLKARLDAADTPATLLRGSQPPQGGKDVLLRQSVEPGERSEELLRASAERA